MGGARKKSGWGVSWTISELSASTPTSERLQPSPGRGGMAQNGRTRGGTFHGEIDRCRENQGCTTAYSGMPERGGKNQDKDSPKQAGSCWFASPSLLTSHKWRELVSSGRLVCRCHGVFSLMLRLFCFASVFVSMLSSKPRPLVRWSFDMQAFR